MRAVLMAGGQGLRMRPLTTTLPKPMLPVVGRPLMEHTVELLRTAGVTDIVVTVGYQSTLIRDYFADGSDFGVDITYVTEGRPLGTAGSVKAAEPLLAGEPFLVLSGDALAAVDLAAFVAEHRVRGAAMSVLTAVREDPREFGVAVLSPDGWVQRLVEKPDWGAVISHTVNTGIYCVEPEVLGRLSEGEAADWAADVIPGLLAAGLPVSGTVTSGYWQDVGSLAAYLAVQRDVLLRRVGEAPNGFQVQPGVWVAEGAEVDPAAVLTAPVCVGAFSHVAAGAALGPVAVLEANTVVGSGARVRNSVVMEGCLVAEGVQLDGAILGRGTHALLGCRVDQGAVVGDDCVLGEESIVAADVHVYPGKTVDAGSWVSESVVWESKTRKDLFGVRGVSGRVNVELTADKAVRLAAAVASTLPKGSSVTVGRDHSRAARAFNRAVIGALNASGMQVRDLRTAVVPIVRSDTAANSAAGIVLRTTPGRPDSLDLLVVDDRGTDIGPGQRRTVQRAYVRNEYRRPFPADIGDVTVPHRVAEDYVHQLISRVNVAGVADAGLRVVVDPGGGAATLLLPALLGQLGLDTLTLDNRIDDSRPTDTGRDRQEALERLCALVAASRCDFGIRFDPAGERLSLVDDRGRVVPDDRAALILLELVSAEGGSPVVLPITGTRVAAAVARRHGAEVRRCGLDEANLSGRVLATGAVLGADCAGGFVVPQVGAHLDPFAAFALLAGLIARTRLSLSAIDARLPEYHVAAATVATPWSRRGQVMRTVRERAGDMRIHDDCAGGVRLEAAERQWVFVAPDPEAAFTRIWAEGESAQQGRSLLQRWERIVAQAAT